MLRRELVHASYARFQQEPTIELLDIYVGGKQRLDIPDIYAGRAYHDVLHHHHHHHDVALFLSPSSVLL